MNKKDTLQTIKISRVLSMDKTKDIGIAIKVGDVDYCAFSNPRGLEGLRVGKFPREYDTKTFKMVSYPKKQIWPISS